MKTYIATNGRCIVSFKGELSSDKVCYTVEPGSVKAHYGDAEWVESEVNKCFVMSYDDAVESVIRTRQSQVTIAEQQLGMRRLELDRIKAMVVPF